MLNGLSPPGDTVVMLQEVGLVTGIALQHRRAGPGCGVETTTPFSLPCSASLGHWSLEKGGPEVT